MRCLFMVGEGIRGYPLQRRHASELSIAHAAISSGVASLGGVEGVARRPETVGMVGETEAGGGDSRGGTVGCSPIIQHLQHSIYIQQRNRAIFYIILYE